MASLTIHDRTATGRPVDSFSINQLPDRITIRELIRTRVRDEVARYNLEPVETFKGLVGPSDAEQVVGGFRLRRPRTLDWERQADVAVDAFERNGFFVLVNGLQATSLHQEIDIRDTADVSFVRLVPLVGG